MNEVPSLRSARAEPGREAAAQTPVDASAESPAGTQAFDDALDEGGELHPQQTRATRTAIKRSLNRLEGSGGGQASRATPARMPTGAGETPRSGADTGDDNAPDPQTSRLSGRRADLQPYGAVSRQQESDPGTRSSVEEAAGSKGRAVDPPRRGTVAGRPESPVTGRRALGEVAAGRKGHAAEVFERGASAEPQQSRGSGRSALGEVAVRRDADGLPSARTPPDREPAGRSARVVAAAKPVGLDGPRGAATDAPGIPGHEGPAPPSEPGRGMERVPEGRVPSAAPTAREDRLPSGVPERGARADAVRHSSHTAGTTGRAPLRHEPGTGEAATDAAENDARVDALDANPTRTAGLEGLAPSAQRTVAGTTGRAPLRDDPDTGEAATDAAENDTGVDALDANPTRTAGLEGLVPSAQRTVAAESVAPEAVRSSAQDIGQVAGQVADRILVSMPAPGAPEEVRITLRDSVLEGSDVRISREAGEIRIVFVAQTEAAQRLLADHRGVFEQTLGESLREERVHVAVEGPDSGDASRSEGDGRSRQQYVPEDDGRLGDIET